MYTDNTFAICHGCYQFCCRLYHPFMHEWCHVCMQLEFRAWFSDPICMLKQIQHATLGICIHAIVQTHAACAHMWSTTRTKLLAFELAGKETEPS